MPFPAASRALHQHAAGRCCRRAAVPVLRRRPRMNSPGMAAAGTAEVPVTDPYRWDTRLAKWQGDGDRRGSVVTGGFVLVAARCLRFGPRGALDEAGDCLAGFGVHPQKRAELGAGDARVPDQGEQFHLILQ
jgi:hypothetical protein